MLYEEDLQSFCDKIQMSLQQVKQWFVEKMGEEIRVVVDIGSEDQGFGDFVVVYKGMGEIYLEVFENSELWEFSVFEVSLEFFDILSFQVGFQLGKEFMGVMVMFCWYGVGGIYGWALNLLYGGICCF